MSSFCFLDCNTNISKKIDKSNSYSFVHQRGSYFFEAVSESEDARQAADAGGRVHPRTRAGGGARKIRVPRSRTKWIVGGAEVLDAAGGRTKFRPRLAA